MAAVIAAPAGAPRRAAPPARRGPRPVDHPQHRRRRHRPAGGALRRPALHAAQGVDGAQARRAGRRAEHKVPAVAIFWIDAEDHDWDEVRFVTVFDETFAPRSVSLPARRRRPAPVATVAPRSVASSTSSTRLERLLPSTEFRGSLHRRLRRAYAPGIGMADAFGRWMEEVLGDRGLIVTTCPTRRRSHWSGRCSRASCRCRGRRRGWRRWPART